MKTENILYLIREILYDFQIEEDFDYKLNGNTNIGLPDAIMNKIKKVINKK